jgi:hypothetical protein
MVWYHCTTYTRAVLIVTVSHRTFSEVFVNFSLRPAKLTPAAIEVILGLESTFLMAYCQGCWGYMGMVWYHCTGHGNNCFSMQTLPFLILSKVWTPWAWMVFIVKGFVWLRALECHALDNGVMWF